MNADTISLQINSISLLTGVKSLPLFQKFQRVFRSYSVSCTEFAAAYSELCAAVYDAEDPGRPFADAILFDENPLTKYVDGQVPAAVLAAADYDISVLSTLLSVSGSVLLEFAGRAFPQHRPFLRQLPGFPCGSPLPFADGRQLLARYQAEGYGFFARSSAFSMTENGPVALQHYDNTQMTDLKGYQRQKDAIIANTEALLHGKKANNILLYGDKGTGKSSTVKAVANLFAPRGLKILELPIQLIARFPDLCREIRQAPFPFIVFLDDLNFSSEDENFAALKAFIEGGIAGTPDNLVIYATSNRRHLIRENFRSRDGDEVHVRDTIESITSLSDRFGLEITFLTPDKDEFLYIVDSLAEEFGLQLPPEELHLLAERFAIRKNGRSARCARQFISHMLASQTN